MQNANYITRLDYTAGINLNCPFSQRIEWQNLIHYGFEYLSKLNDHWIQFWKIFTALLLPPKHYELPTFHLIVWSKYMNVVLSLPYYIIRSKWFEWRSI